jgi:hypothetical protein
MNIFTLLTTLTLAFSTSVQAAQYELIYKEEEQGIEPYLSRTAVTQRYLRIDDLSDDSGYVLYDDATKKVYSVSHFDRSILVIEREPFTTPAMSENLVTTDVALKDAPKIADKQVHDYRVELKAETIEEMCTHIQYVPGLLAAAGELMHQYHLTMAGSHVGSLEQVPPEYQTPCMLSDQVYFDGKVYAAGLPVMEWRSNGKKKYLQNFQDKSFEAALFELPADYRRINLN